MNIMPLLLTTSAISNKHLKINYIKRYLLFKKGCLKKILVEMVQIIIRDKETGKLKTY